MPFSSYPDAPRHDLTENLHGHLVRDPYRWLEDADLAATKEWAAAQDELFANAAAELPGRDSFAQQVQEFLSCGFEGAPVWRGRRRFYTRREPGQEHGVLYAAENSDVERERAEEAGGERVLIDPMAIAPDGTTTLDSWHADPEGRLLAYQLSAGGDEESLLYCLDVDSGDVVDGPVDRCRYSPIAWLPDGTAFYYVRRLPPEEVPGGEDQYHRRVYLHRVGAPTEEDVLVFGTGRDKTEYYGVQVSRNGRWLTLTAAPGTASRNDAWIADLERSGPERPQLIPIQEGVDAEVAPHVGRDGRLYLFTDRDAPRGRLCVADPAAPDYGNWHTHIPSDPEAVLSGFAILDGPELADRPVLLALWRRHAISEITVHDLASGARQGTITLPGLGSVGILRSRPEGGHEAWLTYTDHTCPVTVYRYDARTGALSLWAQPPGRPELPEVRTEQVTYTSKDGTLVRMLVLSPAGAAGPHPAILYGYGGFSISLTPAYSATALSWVKSGGVYAIVNLRGGLEEGEDWHRAGMLERKQNVFDDFIAAAEHLVATGTTTPGQLAAMGGSNGGLLVGAAITQRPDLFAAAVCSAPLLDMVRYEKFPLGQLWSVEFGSAENPEQLGWLLGYSPYHRARLGVSYPAILFTVFDNDSRVDPMHARKMCAALQHATSADPAERPILLRREAEVGHSARSVSRSVALSSDYLAFLAHHTGQQVPDGGAAGNPSGTPRRHVHQCQVRYADLDPQNHVNNVRMLTYLEDARIALLRWSDEGGTACGPMVVAKQEARYIAPLRLRPDPVRVEVWAADLRRASVTLHYEIRDEDTLYLSASTVLVGFDTETQHARRLTEEERALLANYLEG